MSFSKTILQWYQVHKRELPWRNSPEPYTVWLSEIMLQQTRVAQGLPYFLKFVTKYPTVCDLAAAPEEELEIYITLQKRSVLNWEECFQTPMKDLKS